MKCYVWTIECRNWVEISGHQYEAWLIWMEAMPADAERLRVTLAMCGPTPAFK